LPANKVQRFREGLMMSKAELARRAGLSTLTIDRVESGRPCRLDTKKKVLIALGLAVKDHGLLFGAVQAEEVIEEAQVRFSDLDSRGRQNPWT